ncbi:MAG: phosphate ABC transporter permease subunit PstC [Epsilonproteobacteria bacterium]|nr:phosphate ABC transporter permease subunit PstC [Campylobacterota bacterium]
MNQTEISCKDYRLRNLDEQGSSTTRKETLFRFFLIAAAIISVSIVMGIFVSLLFGSWKSINEFGLNFIWSSTWNPAAKQFGALPFIIGTLSTSFLALLISAPFSFASAIYLSLYLKNGWFSGLLKFSVELLAGIPSIIYGFWGLFVLVPIVRSFEIKLGFIPYGVGVVTASIILAIMIIPFASSMASEVIKLVPQDLKEAGFAMGATRFEVIKNIILPYASGGIFSGILLAFGRAFGETMAVTMVIGNSNIIPKNIFSPANSMASVIANEFTEARGNLYLSSLIEIGLLLFIISFIVNAIGNRIMKKMTVKK